MSVGEFTLALERILRGFGYKVKPIHDETTTNSARETETDLHNLAHQAGEGLEMVFFCTLRNQIHADLHGKPELLRVKGLRRAVQKLTGSKKWCPRCQKLEAEPEDHQVLGHLLLKAREIAGELGLHENGFRFVINNGKDAGESVPHLHLHILGGRAMAWPPG